MTALQPHQSTYNNVCKQYVYVCIYGKGMYLLLQRWLQVLTCIIILDYLPSGSLKKVDNSKQIKKASNL